MKIVESSPIVPYAPNPNDFLSFLEDPNIDHGKTVYVVEQGFIDTVFYTGATISNVETSLRGHIDIRLDVHTQIFVERHFA